MAKANPTRPDPPGSEARLHDPVALADTSPPLQNPRSVAGIDTIDVDEPTEPVDADLLDLALEDEAGGDGSHRSFADDVRSDSNDDEKHERR